MNLPPSISRSRPAAGLRLAAAPDRRGFTMIEIAVSLAIIAFAMVAIIGVLPTGMSAQRENREETIINQDASIFIEAIRSGGRGLDDLTNYVVSITNYSVEFNVQTNFVSRTNYGHTYESSGSSPGGMPSYRLTNGFRIVGLLSTPRIVRIPDTALVNPRGFYSNYVVAVVRSLSGPANEKYPQTNAEARELTFTYRLIPEVSPFSEFDTNWAWAGNPAIATDPEAIFARSNYWQEVKNLQTNLWDLRLLFRWPIRPNGEAGNGRQVYRTMASGKLLRTNDSVWVGYPMYFFEPRNFVKVP
jgi:prepilin-type N-terminal cleavage/methylation domain-containing protein